MTAIQLTELVTHILYLAIFAVTLASALRRPTRANVDIALFFGTAALIIVQQRLANVLPLSGEVGLDLVLSFSGLLPYALLRLVADFSDVPAALLRIAELGLAALVIAAFAIAGPQPLYLLLYSLYFVTLTVYAAFAFVREAARSTGVTRRRLEAVGVGAAFLGLTLGFAVAATLTRSIADAAVITQLLALASGVAFYVGFAPPSMLRRAWQEPELRAFLAGAARLPRLPDTLAIVRELERGAASSTGAAAGIALWQERERVLRFWQADGRPVDVPSGRFISGKAFASRRAIFTANAPRDDPDSADLYREGHVVSVLAAPIVAGERPLGVLVVYSPRAPIFGEADLALVQLLAHQAAVVLESRGLIDEAARVRAEEEATRLKEDFLSAAAHDLRTPLTTIVTQAQLLEQRAERDPNAPSDIVGIRRLVHEARRLNTLVVELLDAARAQRGQLLAARERVDLTGVIREVATEHSRGPSRVVVETDGALEGDYDCSRVRQLLDNLLENALKYSPDGGDIRVMARRDGEEARIDVRDQGIGIPPDDLPHVFERFRRGANVDDRRVAGMGLGLYICRGIAEQHGGRIWAESELGRGSTFHVALPVSAKTFAAGVGGGSGDA